MIDRVILISALAPIGFICFVILLAVKWPDKFFVDEIDEGPRL